MILEISQFFLTLDIDSVKFVWSILAFSVLQQFLLVFHLSFKNIARLTSSKLLEIICLHSR